jgi:transcriptional regulator with XRE-family HTH domain
MPDSLGKRLKNWRGKKYQKEAADELGVPLRTYQQWEKDLAAPNKICLKCLEEKITPKI